MISVQRERCVSMAFVSQISAQTVWIVLMAANVLGTNVFKLFIENVQITMIVLEEIGVLMEIVFHIISLVNKGNV